MSPNPLHRGPIIILQEFCQQLSIIANQEIDPNDPRTMVGAFQKFRPDPGPLKPLFSSSSNEEAVFERLEQVYEICGTPRRSDGMKDAFFIVREPEPVSPEVVKSNGGDFYNVLGTLAFEQNHDDLASSLNPVPEIRIIEGAVPKHPKSEDEKSSLLKLVSKTGPVVTDELRAKNPLAKFLSRATYFIACDAFLRDYILWPLVSEFSNVEDPFENYFQIWKHGVKYRIFGEKQIDLYMPRFF